MSALSLITKGILSEINTVSIPAVKKVVADITIELSEFNTTIELDKSDVTVEICSS